MEQIEKLIEGVELKKTQVINNVKGDIRKIINKCDNNFKGFGEAYLTNVKFKEIKGFKLHTKMVLNLFVISGEIMFYMVNEQSNQKCEVTISEKLPKILTIQPNIWMAFEGKTNAQNVLLNIANIKHDPKESRNKEITFKIS